jgi:hypothetical protein
MLESPALLSVRAQESIASLLDTKIIRPIELQDEAQTQIWIVMWLKSRVADHSSATQQPIQPGTLSAGHHVAQRDLLISTSPDEPVGLPNQTYVRDTNTILRRAIYI